MANRIDSRRLLELCRQKGWMVLNQEKLSARTIDDARAVAAGRGWECLSREMKSVMTPLIWRCAAGHSWSAPLKNVMYGKACRKCSELRAREVRMQCSKCGTLTAKKTTH